MSERKACGILLNAYTTKSVCKMLIKVNRYCLGLLLEPWIIHNIICLLEIIKFQGDIENVAFSSEISQVLGQKMSR